MDVDDAVTDVGIKVDVVKVEDVDRCVVEAVELVIFSYFTQQRILLGPGHGASF